MGLERDILRPVVFRTASARYHADCGIGPIEFFVVSLFAGPRAEAGLWEVPLWRQKFDARRFGGAWTWLGFETVNNS